MTIIQSPTESGLTWLSFQDPISVIETYRIDEVVRSLSLVEELVEGRGLHAAGFISYEAAPAFDPYFQTHPAGYLPLLWFGIYPEPEVVQLPSPSPENKELKWEPSVTHTQYEKYIDKIKDYIARGDTYQVNFTFRLNTVFSGDPFQMFLRMNRSQQAGYGAFIDTGRYQICSASPELFFFQDGENIHCRPMKGTIARGRSSTEDSAQIDRLYHSVKDRAENLMIVDMIRNDLSRIARPGSVRVKRLFEVERYPTVFQMTSSVTARTTALFPDIISALFPCASITGAPRIRTMEIIAGLETTARQIYTGCIGYISPGSKAQFNVAIRTVLIDSKTHRAEYGVGGGIVWDSKTKDEYSECRIKAKILTTKLPEFSLLETMRWTPKDGYYLREEHLDRLEKSATYFGFIMDPEMTRRALKNYSASLLLLPHKIRLLLHRDGKITLEQTRLNNLNPSRPRRIKLSQSPVDSRNPFLYHKTTYRRVYDQANFGISDCDDVLLWNERREITETTIANVIIERDGELITPAVNSGLLPGTARTDLLKQKIIREEVITLDELNPGDSFYLINSVRGWQKAVLIN